MLQWMRALSIVLLAFVGWATATAGELVTYYHNDVAGSPVAATDEKGYFIWHSSYEPYGERIQSDADYTASLENKRWFTSHVEDVETGTIYMQARHYDPAIGRFMSMDPVGFTPEQPHTFTRYAYAANNPYGYVDPDGRETVGVIARNPFIGFAESGSRAAAGAYAFYSDPHISDQTKIDTAAIGMMLMTSGTIAFSSRTVASLFGLASAPNNLADGLPPVLPRFLAGGKTLGVLRTAAGDIPLQSGRTGAAASMPRGSSGFDIVTRTHVEGHAAALMRQNNIDAATLYINNPKICSSCSNLLPRMLPPSSQLTVVTPSGSTTFVGIKQ